MKVISFLFFGCTAVFGADAVSTPRESAPRKAHLESLSEFDSFTIPTMYSVTHTVHPVLAPAVISEKDLSRKERKVLALIRRRNKFTRLSTILAENIDVLASFYDNKFMYRAADEFNVLMRAAVVVEIGKTNATIRSISSLITKYNPHLPTDVRYRLPATHRLLMPFVMSSTNSKTSIYGTQYRPKQTLKLYSQLVATNIAITSTARRMHEMADSSKMQDLGARRVAKAVAETKLRIKGDLATLLSIGPDWPLD